MPLNIHFQWCTIGKRIKGARAFSRTPLAAGQRAGLRFYWSQRSCIFERAITQTTHDIAFYQISLAGVLDSRVIRFRGHNIFAAFSPAAAARQPMSFRTAAFSCLPIRRILDKFEITAHRVPSYNAIPTVYSLFRNPVRVPNRPGTMSVERANGRSEGGLV